MEPDSGASSLEPRSRWVSSIGLWLGLVLFVIFFLVPPSEESDRLPSAARDVAAVTVLCATWWVTQAIPIPVR